MTKNKNKTKTKTNKQKIDLKKTVEESERPKRRKLVS